MTTAEIRDQLASDYPECLLADGFDDAIVGVVEGCGRPTVICYDYEKCVEVLMRDSRMDEDTAREYLEFNTVGAYVGELTPLFLHYWR